MADEVTKKDLQALQANLNKVIADLEKRVNTKLETFVKTTNDAIKANQDWAKGEFEKLRDWAAKEDKNVVESSIKVAEAVNNHAKLIAELQKKCD